VLALPNGSGGVTISGDPAHPANFGRLCSKGSALAETLSLDQRLLHPMMRQADGSLVRIDWDMALDRVANGLRTIIDRDGPSAIAFYLSGQLLTEDYYIANKLMKGFLGSSNVDTNSRLCMASSVAGHRRAFGADTVPGIYRDLDAADLIVLVGSNAAWCHPVLHQRMMAARSERGAKLITIDPRRTATADDADLFLPIAPGMDTSLFCGLLAHLADSATLDHAYIDRHTAGFAEALARSREIAPDAAATARVTALGDADVARFFELFRKTERVVTCFSQGVNQSAQGTDKVNAIINVHLATGRIGRPGMGPFSLTGQPNAMGGREVGGLANQLAAHMGFSSAEKERVGRFWNAPSVAAGEGLKAVDMFEAIERGTVKALWVMATNPAVSLPRANAMRAALKNLELFVISENVISNDTIEAGAQVLLPAAAWGEKDGTVTNSERRISRQRAFLPLPGEARPDWWIVREVAWRLGFSVEFNYRGPADIFREHAALSAFENDGQRDFDIGALAELSDASYDGLDPVSWPARARHPPGEQRFFGAGKFFTPDRRARFVAPEWPRPRTTTSADFPLRLNTGRLRDQWHTMTRTGMSPRLCAHSPEPFIEIHRADAKAKGLTDGGFAKVTT
jgi:assimilatory nitrate reductase catalytic subunit